MKRLRAHISENTILYRMIAGYAFVCTVLILCMSSLMYHAFRTGIEKEIYRSQVQSLKQVSNTVGFRAEYANSLMQQAKNEKEVMQLFNRSNEINSVSGLDKLAKIRRNVKQLQSVYVYNESNGTIYCSAESNLSAVSNLESFEDQGFIDILDHVDQYEKYTPFLRMSSVISPDGQVHNTYVYTYLLYDTFSSGKITNVIAFNFHLGWMEDALDFITNGDQMAEKIWIVNRDHQIVYTDTGKLMGTVVDDQEQWLDEVYGQEAGYVITGDKGSRKMLVYATPDHRGYEQWTFLSWNDYSSMLEPMNRVRIITCIILAVGLVISILVIILLSGHIYKPVKKTIDKVESLEMEQIKKQNMDRMFFLRKLFLGNVSDDINKIRENFKQLNIAYELETENIVLLLSVDYISSFMRKYGRNMEQADQVIQEVLQEEFCTRYASVILVKMQDGLWAACIPDQKEAENTEGHTKENLAKMFAALNQKLDEELQITISMAASERGYSVRDIPYQYSRAITIRSYRYLLGQNQLICSEDIEKQEHQKYEYPMDIEKKLLTSLYSGKAVETNRAFEEFSDRVQTFAVGEAKLSFMLLAYAIKNSSRNTTAEASSVLMEFDQFYQKLQALETVHEVKQMFFHLIGEIIEKLQGAAKERHDQLLHQITGYVEEHFSEISLSMNEVSDYVNMSAAYLGRMFKQITGTTFTEYLTGFRLKEACRLLKNTEKTVNEISDEVGFTNSSYFYIVFKKNTGCTPNQYRKQQMEQDDLDHTL